MGNLNKHFVYHNRRNEKIFIFAAHSCFNKTTYTTMSSDTSKRYALRGVSAGKEDVHNAIKKHR
jgi:hypothetical protein